MIPKIIHFCWLSDEPYPESIQKCMNSWKEKLPDYEIWKWDFKRFPKGSAKWVDQAFEKRKYAFAADYIRLYALSNYGGIYPDSDEGGMIMIRTTARRQNGVWLGLLKGVLLARMQLGSNVSWPNALEKMYFNLSDI